MTVPPSLSVAYYKLLASGAKKLGMSRAKLAIDSLRYYLKALDRKNAPRAKALGSEELAEGLADAQRKIAKKWWSTISPEDKAERIKKANEARWPKKRK